MKWRYWVMPEGGGPVTEIDQEDAEDNNFSMGIFRTWNEYEGTRTSANVKKIHAWAIDIDGANKNEQAELIKKSPIVPSLIVESCNGFHVYWFAKNATIKNFKKVMMGLEKFFSADKRALDMARILRAPGFKHLKDPLNPFLVEEVFTRNISYDENEMLKAFPSQEEIIKYEEDSASFKDHGSTELWDLVYSMDCKKVLESISGSPEVNGEKYEFLKQRNGNWNILSNKKSTSCFIDKAGRIGSPDGGGPTIYRWLLWIHKDKKKVISIMKQLFPQLPWKA